MLNSSNPHLAVGAQQGFRGPNTIKSRGGDRSSVPLPHTVGRWKKRCRGANVTCGSDILSGASQCLLAILK